MLGGNEDGRLRPKLMSEGDFPGETEGNIPFTPDVACAITFEIEDDGRCRPKLGGGSQLSSDLVAGVNGDLGTETREVAIQGLRSGSAYQVQLFLNGYPVLATVDTAAEVTILADHVLDEWGEKPSIVDTIVMHTAGKELSINAAKLQPIRIGLGPFSSWESVYVAPIKDDVLLGLDYLSKHKVKLDLEKGEMELNGVIIGLSRQGDVPEISSGVQLLHSTRIKPNTRVTVPCMTEGALQEPIMIEGWYNEGVIVLDTLVSQKPQPMICLLNPTDQEILVPASTTVAFARSVSLLEGDECIELGEGYDSSVRKGEGENISESNVVPEYLKDMVERAVMNLDEEQKLAFQSLILQYVDVFAKDDFDLGHFTAVHHSIDTGDAKPVKQKMRRTPIHFVGEEKKHLEKMLKSGVIRPSVSEWAAPPVLVR